MVNINGMFSNAYERKNNCRPGMRRRIKLQLFYVLVHTYIDQIQVSPFTAFTIHVRLQTITTLKFSRLTLKWNYSSPTSISMYKYIQLHIDMGIKLLPCFNGVRFVVARLLLIPNYNTRI